ncbi:neoverrucotoxin subunit alpha-like [Pimephales promelas]|uniref:neoverrucotoxin subunit alpha-like n=1 Tax=Pimephales promelas TaxID=90988 RepID=UPI001955B440|nr:neoverrucotoxin subunit alpha-like [Pimephales promelas]
MMTSRLHRYAVDLTLDLTLDPNTAHTRLALSEENRKVTHMRESQSYPDHPDRFEYDPLVLCRESLTGRCYWEAEWSGDKTDISVSYKRIKRKGGMWFGNNLISWSLERKDSELIAWYNCNPTYIPVSGSKRVGVFLDESAGTLSFYSVSDTHTLTHLHTFTHTFTEPLYAGFRLYHINSSVSLCQIQRKCGTI